MFGYSLDDSDKPVFLVWPERTESNGFWPPGCRKGPLS